MFPSPSVLGDRDEENWERDAEEVREIEESGATKSP